MLGSEMPDKGVLARPLFFLFIARLGLVTGQVPEVWILCVAKCPSLAIRCEQNRTAWRANILDIWIVTPLVSPPGVFVLERLVTTDGAEPFYLKVGGMMSG